MAVMIHIELGKSGSAGTRATVTRTRWFRPTAVDVYVCHKAAGVLNAQWINERTGALPTHALQDSMSVAAQAAARLAGKA